MFDLTTEGRNIIADTFLSFEIWMTVAAIYLALTVPCRCSWVTWNTGSGCAPDVRGA